VRGRRLVLAYAGLGLHWAFGGGGFPFGTNGAVAGDLASLLAGRVVVGELIVAGDFDLANRGLDGPALVVPIWGIGLGAATLAYDLRRRGPCAARGRGESTYDTSDHHESMR